MDLEKLGREFKALQQDTALFEVYNLDARIKALDFLAFFEEVLAVQGGHADENVLAIQSANLRHRLNALNENYFQQVRGDLIAGNHTPQSLRRQFDRHTAYPPFTQGWLHLNFEGLDALVSGVLLPEPLPEETLTRTPDMISCQATPASAVLDLIDHIDFAPDDVFYDIGSGLGQVVMLVNLLAQVKAVGIEFEPAFCDYARVQTRKLGLSNIEYVNIDARDADYSQGTVFFMFTPFTGRLWDAVLEKLHEQAIQRPIRICTYGPCTPEVAKLDWVQNIDGNADHEFKLAVFDN